MEAIYIVDKNCRISRIMICGYMTHSWYNSWIYLRNAYLYEYIKYAAYVACFPHSTCMLLHLLSFSLNILGSLLKICLNIFLYYRSSIIWSFLFIFLLFFFVLFIPLVLASHTCIKKLTQKYWNCLREWKCQVQEGE